MSIWDNGDYVPLTLFVPEGDNTTGATIQWTDPSTATGAVSPAPVTSDGGKTWLASHQVTQVGNWIFTWSITGMGAGIEKSTVYVTDGSPVPWIPSLRSVADYVPSRTVPVDSPISTPQMTFNTSTIPSGEQAHRQILSAVRWVISRVGTVDTTLYAHAHDVASLRAAGLIELSYPERDGDVNTATALLAQAELALKDLVTANVSVTGVSNDPSTDLLPQYAFPYPTTTEDLYPMKTSWWGGQTTW